MNTKYVKSILTLTEEGKMRVEVRLAELVIELRGDLDIHFPLSGVLKEIQSITGRMIRECPVSVATPVLSKQEKHKQWKIETQRTPRQRKPPVVAK
jgi:hypothetical protein